MTKPLKTPPAEQCDLRSQHGSKYRQFEKRKRNKCERRRAKSDPDCTPGYGFFRGYVS